MCPAPLGASILWAADTHLGKGGSVSMTGVQSRTPQAPPSRHLARPSGPWGPARKSPGCQARSREPPQLGDEAEETARSQQRRNWLFSPFFTKRVSLSRGRLRRPPAAFSSSHRTVTPWAAPIVDSNVQGTKVRTVRSRTSRSRISIQDNKVQNIKVKGSISQYQLYNQGNDAHGQTTSCLYFPKSRGRRRYDFCGTVLPCNPWARRCESPTASMCREDGVCAAQTRCPRRNQRFKTWGAGDFRKEPE